MKKINEENNEDISKNIPLDISEIKEDNKSMFCSGISLENLNNGQKNVYDTNTYNIKQNFFNTDSKNILDLNNKISGKIKYENNKFEKESNFHKIESDIKILTYIWKSKLLISGYYEYEILFTKKEIKPDETSKILIQRTLYRSYTDLEILNQGLILYNPGCIIPKIPSKSSDLESKENIEETRNKLENYLGYICKHEYLSKNPIFLIFISDEFERYRDKINENNTESYSVFSLIKLCLNEGYKFSKSLITSKLLSSSIDNNETDMNSSIEISDENLRDEKIRLEKIILGTEKFITSLGEEINSVSDKIESLKNLNKISNILKDSNFRVELNQNNIDESFLNQKKFFSLESEVYLKMAENYEIYVEKIKQIHKRLIKYKEVTKALTEAFVRKEKVELEYKKERNSDFPNNNEKLKELEENYRNVCIQFINELSNYHKNIENAFSENAENYIDIKNKTDKNNQIILMKNSIKNKFT